MFGFLWAIVIGLVVGALAKLLMPGKDPSPLWVTALIGIGGSLVATFLGRAMGWYAEGASAGFIASLLGAVLILWLHRMWKSRKQA